MLTRSRRFVAHFFAVLASLSAASSADVFVQCWNPRAPERTWQVLAFYVQDRPDWSKLSANTAVAFDLSWPIKGDRQPMGRLEIFSAQGSAPPKIAFMPADGGQGAVGNFDWVMVVAIPGQEKPGIGFVFVGPAGSRSVFWEIPMRDGMNGLKRWASDRELPADRGNTQQFCEHFERSAPELWKKLQR